MSTFVSTLHHKPLSIAIGTTIPILRPIHYPQQQSLPRIDSFYVHDHRISLPSCSIPPSSLSLQPIFTCQHHLSHLPLFIFASDTCMLDILISPIEHSIYQQHSQYIERQCISNLKLLFRKSNRGSSTISATASTSLNANVDDVPYVLQECGDSLPNQISGRYSFEIRQGGMWWKHGARPGEERSDWRLRRKGIA